MVDLTEKEQAALRYAMKMMAEVMEEIGWETRLIDLTEHQVLTIAEVCVGGFQDDMRAKAKTKTKTKTKTDDTEIPF